MSKELSDILISYPGCILFHLPSWLTIHKSWLSVSKEVSKEENIFCGNKTKITSKGDISG